MLKPSPPEDPNRNSRIATFFIFVYAAILVPASLLAVNHYWKTDVGLCEGILTFVGGLAGGPIIGHYYKRKFPTDNDREGN